MTHLNFDERLLKIKKVLYIWKSRNLSLKGKNNYFEDPEKKILFFFNMIYVPDELLKTLDKMFI